MLFLLLFFFVDFGDADKFSCILKANVVTGSQITDGYISNKKNIVKKLTDSILILYRILIIYLFSGYSITQPKNLKASSLSRKRLLKVSTDNILHHTHRHFDSCC